MTYLRHCLCLAFLALLTHPLSAQETPTKQLVFDFREDIPGGGILASKGTIKAVGTVMGKAGDNRTKGFVDLAHGKGFRMGTSCRNYIQVANTPSIHQLFSRGFSISFGYTLPEKIQQMRPGNSGRTLTLVAVYDIGKNARSFSLRASSGGRIVFEISEKGTGVISCGAKALVPGKRARIDARFIPGRKIMILVDDKRVAALGTKCTQIFPPNAALTIGARLHMGKPVNFGEGIMDNLTIRALADKAPDKSAVPTATPPPPIPALERATTLNLPKPYAEAFTRDNGLRGEICLNGIWHWQPQTAETREQPDESAWLWRKVPAYGSPFFVRNSEGKRVREYKNKKLTGREKTWAETEIHIPAAWKEREVFLEVDGLDGVEPVVILGDRSMRLSPDLPYKFPLAYTDQPIRLRIKARAVKQNVWLRSYPRTASIRYSGVTCSWRQKSITALVEGVSRTTATRSLRIVVAEDSAFSKPVLMGKWQKCPQDRGDFHTDLREPWAAPRPWTPDTPNLYFFMVEMRDADGRIIDRSLPKRFGFREIWIEKGRLKLNGVSVFLRGNNHTPFGTKANYAEHIGCEASIRWLLGKWKRELNANSFLIWGQGLGQTDCTKVFDVADELGMLVVIMIPRGQMDYADNKHIAHYNRRLVSGRVRHYAHHPSLLAWEFPSGHYTWICNPQVLGMDFHPEQYWKRLRSYTEYLLPLKKLIKRLDPGRPVFTHSGGHNRVSDALTGMIYINPDAGLQERSNWPLDWWRNRKYRKPMIHMEISCIFWATLYQRRAANSFPGRNSDPIFLEHAAELFGDSVYLDEPQKYLEQYFDHGKAISLYWQDNPSPTPWRFKKEYLKYSYRAWRTYGLGYFLHVELRAAFDRRRHPTRKPPMVNPQTPGVHPDAFIDANDSAGDLNDWGRAMQTMQQPFYAFIGGDPLFTAKDHAYYAGEPVVKRAVVLNDYFRSLPVTVSWQLEAEDGRTVWQRTWTATVKPGERCLDRFRVQFPAPAVNQRTCFALSLRARSGDMVRTDRFILQVYPRPAGARNAGRAWIFDPVGETRAMLEAAGCELQAVTASLPDQGLLVIGRHVLESGAAAGRLAELGFDRKVAGGLRVIVFEQACDNIMGLRAYENSPRRTFLRAPVHPVLAGLHAADMRHWRGESDLVESWPRPHQVPATAGGWFPKRFWKWGNDNNVATYVIQKPMRGAFRALVDSGFDLMDTPLLESCRGKGRIIFCQLDVTKRYGVEPAATRIVDNLLAYMQNAPAPRSTSTRPAPAKADSRFDGFRLPAPKGKLGWGLNNGDFYFRRKVSIPAFDNGKTLVKWTDREHTRISVSFELKHLRTNWQKYKLLRILAACRMNQDGSSDLGAGIRLQQQNDSHTLYPLNWHMGFVHPYTGWCW